MTVKSDRPIHPKPILTKYRANIFDGREHWVCKECSMIYSRPKPDLDDVMLSDYGEHFPIWRSPLCRYCGSECEEFTLQKMLHNHLIVKTKLGV